MINKTKRSSIIAGCINKYLEMGLTDKQEIFNKVVQELGIARPIVRRVAKDMRIEMEKKIKILQPDHYPPPS